MSEKFVFFQPSTHFSFTDCAALQHIFAGAAFAASVSRQ